MSAIDDINEDLDSQVLVNQCYAITNHRIQQLRKVGYAEYDRFWHRLSRLFKVIKHEKIITRKEWEAIVDSSLTLIKGE